MIGTLILTALSRGRRRWITWLAQRRNSQGAAAEPNHDPSPTDEVQVPQPQNQEPQEGAAETQQQIVAGPESTQTISGR